jgi:hypothetical protein
LTFISEYQKLIDLRAWTDQFHWLQIWDRHFE